MGAKVHGRSFEVIFKENPDHFVHRIGTNFLDSDHSPDLINQ